MPSFDFGPTDLSKAWDWFNTITPVRQVMIATVVIAIFAFIGCYRSKKKALEAKDSSIAGLIAEKDATIQRQQAETSEKTATIERQRAEISALEQRIRHRDDQLEAATKVTAVVSATNNNAVITAIPAPYKIVTPQQLGQHNSRVNRLWDQAVEHRGKFDDACKQAIQDWDRHLSARNPNSLRSIADAARLLSMFPSLTTPEEDMNASLRQLQGIASDYRGTLALLTQALSFDAPKV